MKQTHIKHGFWRPHNTPTISEESKLYAQKTSPAGMKGFCDFRGGQHYPEVCLYKWNRHPISPAPPPPRQHRAQVSKQALCRALGLRFCGFRLVLASRKGKSFLLLSELIPALKAEPVAPCLLTMWGASKSGRCDYLFCQQPGASDRGGPRLTAITHLLSLSAYRFFTMQTFFWRRLSIYHHLPHPNGC